MAIKSISAVVGEIKKDLENLSVQQLEDEMQNVEDLLLLDIREIQENVDLGTIPGAKHAARGMLEYWADPSSPYYRDWFEGENQRIVLFCAGGGRSALAAKAMKEMGYNNVAHLEEGFTGWSKAGKEVEETATRSRWMRKPQ